MQSVILLKLGKYLNVTLSRTVVNRYGPAMVHCGLTASAGPILMGLRLCGLVCPLIKCGLTLWRAKSARALGGSPILSAIMLTSFMLSGIILRVHDNCYHL
jgi:hypothetical protein